MVALLFNDMLFNDMMVLQLLSVDDVATASLRSSLLAAAASSVLFRCRRRAKGCGTGKHVGLAAPLAFQHLSAAAARLIARRSAMCWAAQPMP
jgi:hypothetical protein